MGGRCFGGRVMRGSADCNGSARVGWDVCQV